MGLLRFVGKGDVGIVTLAVIRMNDWLFRFDAGANYRPPFRRTGFGVGGGEFAFADAAN
jgi:hypothetical protein